MPQHKSQHTSQSTAPTRPRLTARRRPSRERDVLACTVEASGDLVATFDTAGRVTYVNPAGLCLLGAPDLDAVRGLPFVELHAEEDRTQAHEALDALLHGPGTWSGEACVRRLDGRGPVLIDAYKFVVRDPETDRIVALACVARDVTERRAVARERERLAEAARHAQRIESLGVLAGGVAHDFNNLLTVILSAVDLVRAELAEAHGAPPVVLEDLDAIHGAAARASTLTRQLLAFSRRQALELQQLDVNAVVTAADGMLRRLVGERVTLDTCLTSGHLPVRADPVQLEQVLVNLVLNARDAVVARLDAAPGGGLVTIETGETTLAADEAARYDVPPGHYVSMAVEDTGVGMDATTRARVFEPFFTTKPSGQGTGLGLAMVYGIVKQSGGAVTIDSTPERGSVFRVLLPRVADGDPAESGAATPASLPRGRETVLLVEDEAAVREVARRVLERAGYTVLEARHGGDALLVWRERRGAAGGIDVLLTDLRMPELDGRALAAALRRDRPGLPVVFISGYGEERPAGDREPRDARDAFLAKPFVAPELQRVMREVLDEG